MDREETRRNNEHERRIAHTMDDLRREDCAAACLIANENRKDIQTLFRRLDEERDERRGIKPGVSWHIFWTVLIAFAAITYGTISAIWIHLNSNDISLEQAIQSISKDVATNTGKVDVVVQRINDFMLTHERLVEQSRGDQTRIINKLDDIGRTVQTIQLKVTKLEHVKGAVP